MDSGLKVGGGDSFGRIESRAGRGGGQTQTGRHDGKPIQTTRLVMMVNGTFVAKYGNITTAIARI